MKHTERRREGLSEKKLTERVQRLLEERGSKPLEMARRAVLEEKIECKEAYEALKFFMSYWKDTARPTLMSIVCEAAGGNEEIIVPVAASIVLISGGIDIHDDIIDRSETKLSHLTILGKFGGDIALLAGDALLFKGLTLLCESVKKKVSAEKISVVFKLINRMFFELGDAEAVELQFRGRTDISPEEYLRLVRKKAADVEALTRISAILGGGSEEEIEKLGEYGRLLGMILILRDDMWDTTDFAETSHRIKNECLPLPILYALQFEETKPRVASIILKESITRRDAREIREIATKSGGLRQSRRIINKFAKKACRVVRTLGFKNNLKLFAVASCIPYLGDETKLKSNSPSVPKHG